MSWTSRTWRRRRSRRWRRRRVWSRRTCIGYWASPLPHAGRCAPPPGRCGAWVGAPSTSTTRRRCSNRPVWLRGSTRPPHRNGSSDTPPFQERSRLVGAQRSRAGACAGAARTRSRRRCDCGTAARPAALARSGRHVAPHRLRSPGGVCGVGSGGGGRRCERGVVRRPGSQGAAPSAAARRARRSREEPFGRIPGPELLPSERRVLDALCAGTSVKEMAKTWGRSEFTIRNQLKRLFAKFGVTSSAALVAKALRSEVPQTERGPPNALRPSGRAARAHDPEPSLKSVTRRLAHLSQRPRFSLPIVRSRSVVESTARLCPEVPIQVRAGGSRPCRTSRACSGKADDASDDRRPRVRASPHLALTAIPGRARRLLRRILRARSAARRRSKPEFFADVYDIAELEATLDVRARTSSSSR